jgi:pimeloyl-ACP methyl ester carboxylesterase
MVMGLCGLAVACRADHAMIAAAPSPPFTPAAPKTIGGRLDASQQVGNFSRATIDSMAAADGYTVLFPDIAGRARCGVTMSEISFTTPAPDDSTLVHATAAVLSPVGTDPPCAGPHPLLVVASGTQYETVRNADITHWPTREVAVMYAAQGFTVVSPDYLGNGNPSRFPDHPKFDYHPYFHAQSEATTLLDSIRAVRAHSSLSGAVMFVGGSQGAHAALAALLLARMHYPDEFDIVAAALNEGPFDLPGMIDVARTSSTITPIYDKAIAAWANLYNDGVPLSYPDPDEVTPIAQANDLLRAAVPDLGFQIQLCTSTRDNVVPLRFTVDMQTKLGEQALPLKLLTGSEIDRGAAVFAPLHADAHAVGGTLCIAEEWDYFDARKLGLEVHHSPGVDLRHD